MKVFGHLLLLAALFLNGCASYTWRSRVPEDLRTLAVPVFENESGQPELDAIVTKYTLRELQREGTFQIARLSDASLKLLGKLTRVKTDSITFDRNFGSRTAEYKLTVVAEITLVDTASGKTLIDRQKIKARTTFLTHGDMLTGLQDAYPRVSKELARSIVDAILAHW
ncbi:MAG: hypothetical protein IJR99_02265 [Kiritimatiellae bacterium]|nr:hypothetical protein [Kiritimatiellia bacterium]